MQLILYIVFSGAGIFAAWMVIRTKFSPKTLSALPLSNAQSIVPIEPIENPGENKKTKAELLQFRLNNLQLVNELSQRITSSLSAEEIFHHLYQTIDSMMGASALELVVNNPINNSRYFFSNVLYSDFTADELAKHNHMSEWCFLNNKEILLDDAENDFGRFVFKPLIMPDQKLAHSLMGFPLSDHGVVMGTLIIISYKKNAFELFHREMIRLLLPFIGVAINNAFNHLHIIELQRLAEHERQRSEELLLNILPEEVALELKAKGETEARQIDDATVLFTDFKGFTSMSEIVSAKQLVKDLHECFSAFDTIVAKHGLEKIKTIGDSYMCAGGLPTANTTHAENAVAAAFEMRDFIAEGKARKITANLPFFEIRIGIHTGPVVAGVVGVRKFQYDIWGDTVNTASRMESSGVPGKLNVSEITYQRIKNKFKCEYRGEIDAKGKGKVKMYFVEK